MVADEHLSAKRNFIRDVLGLYLLDTGRVVDSALWLYTRLYHDRPSPRRGFRKCAEKERIATAFSICQAMTEEGAPRSLPELAHFCGLGGGGEKAFLNVPKALALSEEELERLAPSTYELARVRPADFIDPVCAHVGVPFWQASQARELAEEAQWTHCGSKPAVIAAAVIRQVLTCHDASRRAPRGEDPAVRETSRRVCEMLGVGEPSVARLSSRL